MTDTRCKPAKALRTRPGPVTLVAALLMSTAINAQTANTYTFSTSTGATAHDMTGSSVLVAPNGYISPATNIGFTFNYEGVAYTQFRAAVYGGIRFGSGPMDYGYLQGDIPSKDVNYWSSYITPLGVNANEGTSSVDSKLSGTAPNRVLVLQWNYYEYTSCGTVSTVQLALYEGSNTIEFTYVSGGICDAYNNRSALIGASMSNYLSVNTASHTVSSSTSEPATTWPGNGRRYTFSPPAGYSCTTPVPGNTIASLPAGCAPMNVDLSLQNAVPGTGISYQWQSSPDGNAPWTNVGTDNASYTANGLNATTWFRCQVTCANGPVTVASTPGQVTVNTPALNYYVYNGTQFTESFDNWTDRCSTNDVPTGGYWMNTPAYGLGSWRSSTTTTTESGWPGIGGWNNPQNTWADAPMARFHNRSETPAGTVGTLDFHVNMAAATGAEKLRFDYINGGNTILVQVSTNGGGAFTTLATINAPYGSFQAAEYTIGSTSATTVIRIQSTALGGNNNDTGIDNFRIVPVATCTKPTAPTASVTGPGSASIGWACASCTGDFYVEYGTPGFTLGSGTVAGPFSSSPATITGLANGDYQAYVRQDCGSGDISENSTAVNFSIVAGDLCGNAINIASLGLTADDSNYMLAGNTTGAQNDYASSACGSQPAADVVLYHDVEPGATVAFAAQSTGNLSVAIGGSCPGTTSLACNTGGYLPLGPNVQPVGEWGDPTFVWTNTGCETERVYVLLDGGQVYMWNYSYTLGGATCQAVTGVSATISGLASANVAWNATCSGNVIVEYGLAGFTPGTGATAGGGTVLPVSGTTTGLSGLALATPYHVYVRQDCGNGEYGANSVVATFTIVPGENCAVAIDLANEIAPLIASTTGAVNDVSTLSCGASGGGDLVYFISVPNGATISFEAIHDYNAVVEVSYGVSCPGTVLTCATNLENYTWINSTGSTQNVYWWQDGTGSGDFLLSWDLNDPCAIGTPCDDGDPATINDMINGDCLCVGTPVAPTTAVILELRTPDGSSGEVSWEIVNASDVVVCSGGSYSPGISAPLVESCSLLDGCYRLRVFDSAGDGFGANGGYQLRLTGADPNNLRIIDNLGNFNSGSSSAISGGSDAFCLPMSTQKPLYHHRDRLDFVSNEYLVCEEDLAVSAQWQVGDQTLSGYQFWFFDPNGGFSYRRGRNHATSDGFGNIGATRTCHMRINNWAVANQIPENVLMNVRIRTRVNGVYGDFGPAYRFKIDPVRAQCKLTKLLDYVESEYLSCNSIRNFGPGNWVHARAVPGANKYQFRFRIPAENFVVAVTSNTYFLQLNWATNPLLAGKTYVVDVRASKNGGVTWCAANGPEWGDLCNLTISANAQGEAQNITISGNDIAELRMWPNPNAGDQLWIDLTGIDAGVEAVAVDIFDLAGHRAVARIIPTQGNRLNTVLDLNGALAAGMYVVNISAGDKVYTERLVLTQ